MTAEQQWEDDYDLRVGYDSIGDALGALSQTGHGGNDYTVRRLMMTSEGASDGARALMLHLSTGLGGGGDGLVLHIGARAFALGDAQRSADVREYVHIDVDKFLPCVAWLTARPRRWGIKLLSSRFPTQEDPRAKRRRSRHDCGWPRPHPNSLHVSPFNISLRENREARTWQFDVRAGSGLRIGSQNPARLAGCAS